MKRSLALVYVFGVLLLGIVIGAMGMHLFYAQRFPGPPGRHGLGSGMHTPAFAERLERHLDLTPEQLTRIEEIVRESHAEGRSLHEELLPRVRSQMDETRRRIREVLTPEQQEKFDELDRRHRRRAERFFLGR